MPRGGNHRQLRPGDPILNYASVLLRTMLKDKSPSGDAFRTDLDELYTRYARLIEAIVNHPVTGWTTGGPPSFNYLDTYFEALLIAMPTRIPKPLPLSAEEWEESKWRRAIAGIVSMKAHHRFLRDRKEDDPEAWARFHAIHNAIWNWGLLVERAVNPVFQVRESSHRVVRQYKGAVAAFCKKWRLQAAWAENVVVDHHFARCCFGYNGFLPLITSASWEDDSIALIVQVPGTDAETYEAERERFTRCEMFTNIDQGAPVPVTLRWTPDQQEQQQYEREQNASCVVVRWEHSFATKSERTEILRYVVEECSHRVGRSLLKREVRDLSCQIDPQIRAMREQFAANGWHIVSDAPLTSQAQWLARKLLTGCSWKALTDSIALDVPKEPPPDERTVRRACQSFASHAELALPPRRRRAA